MMQFVPGHAKQVPVDQWLPMRRPFRREHGDGGVRLGVPGPDLLGEFESLPLAGLVAAHAVFDRVKRFKDEFGVLDSVAVELVERQQGGAADVTLRTHECWDAG